MSRWLPELVRAEPSETLEALYRVVAGPPPAWRSASLQEALLAAHVAVLSQGADGSMVLGLTFRTLVYGLVAREVDEAVALSFRLTDLGLELRLRCRPCATHDAHAAGMAGVVALAAAVWLTGGWGAGIPAALTTVVAGFLWTSTARDFALQGLQRRLRRLAEDLGTALWPGLPAELLPPPPRLVS